eukprot:Tbor_TRINITY_DN4914_c0_g1::TRINITY_DN4914_c0_g1_i2::g.10022::m.10022
MFSITIVRPCPKHVLGLSSNDHSQQKIKEAYRRLAKLHHPDTGGNIERFKEVCSAYELLSGKAIRNGEGSSSGTGFYDHPHCRDSRSSDAWYDSSEASEQHGMHSGARWANQNGASANYSTRDFYRPYDHNTSGGYRQSHGFTEEEVYDARRRTYMHFAWKSGKFTLVACSLAYMYYECSKQDRIQDALNAQKNGYSAEYIEKLKRENSDEKLKRPKSYFERKIDEMEKEVITRQQNKNEFRDSKPNFCEHDRYEAFSLAVSYKGMPFTPEGLAAARERNRGTTLLDTDSLIEEDTIGISYEMDE